MNHPPLLVQRLFLERLRAAHGTNPQGWVLVEDLTREAFGAPAIGLPVAGPTAKGTLTLTQRASVSRAIRALSSQGLVEFAEQLPTERRRTSRPSILSWRGNRRSIWARLAVADTQRPGDRRADQADQAQHSA